MGGFDFVHVSATSSSHVRGVPTDAGLDLNVYQVGPTADPALQPLSQSSFCSQPVGFLPMPRFPMWWNLWM